MKLYDKWKQITENHENQDAEVKFWENYLKEETNVYKKILEEKENVLEGKLNELAKKYGLEEEYFIGFIDGINESIKESVDLETLDSSSDIKLEIDFEKLYYNMVSVEAQWLYTLPGWSDILSEERRKEIEKEYKSSKTIVKGDKVGRNEACPCGSGKKYKKCCGK